MKPLTDSIDKTGWLAWLPGSALVVCICTVWSNTAKSDNLPGLRIQDLGSNQIQLTVTNGVSTNSYEIYRRSLFDPLYPWTWHMSGTNGQTNFTTGMSNETVGFFQARSGSDADGDGIPNWADADPFNSSIGILTITIDSPTNGSVIQ